MNAAPPPAPTATACPLDAWLAQNCGAASLEDLPRALHAAQEAALRRQLVQARRAVFYGPRLTGLDLERLTLEDLPRLPFTTPADLRQWQDLLCVSLGAVQRMVTLHTSGTTGTPKRMAFTEGDLARTREFFAVGMRQLVRTGDRLAVLLPGADRPDGVADVLRQALTPAVDVRTPPPSLLAGPAGPWAAHADLARWLTAQRPHALIAMPGQLAALLHSFPQSGPPGLRGVLSSAEPLDPVLRHLLCTVWQCEILDHYGLTETAYGGAVECPAHNGCHIRALDLLVEIVDPCGTEVLPPGEEGEIVITTLQREAMPLIRYRTGDVARLLPGPCACGSPLPRLSYVRGRLQHSQGRVLVVRPHKGGREA